MRERQRVPCLTWEAELAAVPPGAVRHAAGREAPAGFKMALVLSDEAPEQNGVYLVPAIELLAPKERERERRHEERWRRRAEAETRLNARPCALWSGPGGDCATCGVSAYSHPGAPTPAQRGCEKFVSSGLIGALLGEAARCRFCQLPARDHKEGPAARLLDRARLGSGIAWPPLDPSGDWPVHQVAIACDRTRRFLSSLDYLSVSDARQASELRHRLRAPGLGVLHEAVLFLGGVHPARPGQADLVGDLMRIVGPPEKTPIWPGDASGMSRLTTSPPFAAVLKGEPTPPPPRT